MTMHTPLCVVAAIGLGASALAGTGRIDWRVELPDAFPHFHRQGLAADGTVYVPGRDGLVAVSPRGEVLWTAPGRSGGGPIAVGGNGTIYSAEFASLIARDPDGTELWRFDASDTQGVIAGPNIGPDGNIYVVFDGVPDGPGVMSFDSDGNERWASPGDPPVHQNGGGGREIAFGADRLYVAFSGRGNVPPALWAFDLPDGDQAFYLDSGCDSVPVVNQDGRVIVANGACGVTGYTPDGVVDWVEDAPDAPSDAMLTPVTGPDGSIYTAHNLWRFWSLDADGNTRWYIDDQAHGAMGRFGVAPDNSVLLDLGAGFGGPGWVRAYDTTDAALLWHVDLPQEADGSVVAASPPVFTPDSRRAYFSARPLGGDRSFLYAIDFGACEVTGDVNDGVVDFADLLLLLAAWGPCEGECPADLNQDGFVNFEDLLILLANWS